MFSLNGSRSITVQNSESDLMHSIALRLDGVNLSRTPSFYLTHLDGGVERNTFPCKNS